MDDIKSFEDKQKKIIVNADDFGASKMANVAIIKAHVHGILTSASVIATGNKSDLEEAVRLVRENPSLEIGVHISFNSDKISGLLSPVSKGVGLSGVKSNNGFFTSSILKTTKWLSSNSMKESIRTEMREQIEKILEYGFEPVFINSHYYLCNLEQPFKLIVKLAKEYNISALRVPFEKWDRREKKLLKNVSFKANLKRKILNRLSRNQTEYARNQGIYVPDQYYGVMLGGEATLYNLELVLSMVKPGVTEVLTHPLTKNIGRSRGKEELKALVSENIQIHIKNNNIVLTTFKEASSN